MRFGRPNQKRPIRLHQTSRMREAPDRVKELNAPAVAIVSTRWNWLRSRSSLAHRELIITLAAKDRLPAIYSDRIFVSGGGLMSYYPDRLDQYRRAASYVDRILRGEKPADPSGAGADQIRAGGQSQDCEGDWLRSAGLETYGSHLFFRRILFLRRFCFNRICLFLFLWLNFFIAASTSLRGW